MKCWASKFTCLFQDYTLRFYHGSDKREALDLARSITSEGVKPQRVLTQNVQSCVYCYFLPKYALSIKKTGLQFLRRITDAFPPEYTDWKASPK